jgi:hypothetical protein
MSEVTEIEITPEMIEAGADVIRFHSLDDHRATEIAALVFRAMASAGDTSPGEGVAAFLWCRHD